MEAIEQWIRDWLKSRRNGQLSEVDKADDLVAKGLIDSLDMIELIAAIEAEYRIELSAKELQRFDFVTIRGMSEAISREINGQD